MCLLNYRISKVCYALSFTGRSGTHAGLVIVMRSSSSSVPVSGIGTKAAKDKREDKVGINESYFTSMCGTVYKFQYAYIRILTVNSTLGTQT